MEAGGKGAAVPVPCRLGWVILAPEPPLGWPGCHQVCTVAQLLALPAPPTLLVPGTLANKHPNKLCLILRPRELHGNDGSGDTKEEQITLSGRLGKSICVRS